MAEPAFIAGDWGTSHLRLFLCDASGGVLARQTGPGIAQAGGEAARVLAEHTGAWDKDLPAVLSGMVGSTIGWREVPYLSCPVAAQAVAQGALQFESDGRRIALAPGLACRNASGLPDVMRGEETQLLGALQLEPSLGRGRQLFCLPGTHTKWVLVEDSAVVQFQTALAGELFAALSAHSVLTRGSGAVRADHPSFATGAGVARDQSQAGLLHLLFSTRSRQLAGEIERAQAASYLSGLVIGEDVAAALRLFAPHGEVFLVGAPALSVLYAEVLGGYDLTSTVMDGDAAALAGLTYIHASLFGI